MTTNSVSFSIGSGQSLQLTRSGENTASMVEGSSTYSLGNVTYTPGYLSCDVLGWFNTDLAHIDVTWTQPKSGQSDLEVTITKCWLSSENGVNDYSVAPSSIAELEDFASGFPRG